MLGNIKTYYKRSYSVSRLWSLSVQSHIKAASPVGHGWEDDMSVEWIKKPFPEEVELLTIESQEELEGLEEVKWDSNSEFDLDSD